MNINSALEGGWSNTFLIWEADDYETYSLLAHEIDISVAHNADFTYNYYLVGLTGVAILIFGFVVLKKMVGLGMEKDYEQISDDMKQLIVS